MCTCSSHGKVCIKVTFKKFIMTKDIHNYHQLQIIESLIMRVEGTNYAIIVLVYFNLSLLWVLNLSKFLLSETCWIIRWYRSRQLPAVLQSDSHSELTHDGKQEQTGGGNPEQDPDPQRDRHSCRLQTTEGILQWHPAIQHPVGVDQRIVLLQHHHSRAM